MYEWDKTKRKATLSERGIDFADMERFDWSTAVTRPDTRTEYGEPRFTSHGMIDGRLHACAWTIRKDRIRIIMLRKANAREQGRYEQEKLH